MAQPPFSVNQVIARGHQIVNRKPHPTYSMDNRGYDMYASAYDCSSFQGVINGIYSCPATPAMVPVYMGYGYIHLKFTGLGNLKKGDVLVYNKPGTSGFGAAGHTAMYAGNGMFLQCHGGYGPDYRAAWGEGYWQDVLRNPRGGIAISKWRCTSHPKQSFG